VKQVECRSALQSESGGEESVFKQLLQQFHQPIDLLQEFDAEAGFAGEPGQGFRRKRHAGSSQFRSATETGTTRFHRDRKRVDSLLPRLR